MHILKLKVLPRLVLSGLLDRYMQQGPRSLSELSKLIKINDKLAFNAEETKELNIHKEKNPDTGAIEMRWWNLAGGQEGADVVDFDRDVELSDEQKEMVYNVFKDLDERKQFNGEGAAIVLEIAEKIGYEVK